MTTDFRSALKPGTHRVLNNFGRMGFYAVLRRNRKIVWRGHHYSVTLQLAETAKARAMEEAKNALRCDDDSQMAEELSALVT